MQEGESTTKYVKLHNNGAWAWEVHGVGGYRGMTEEVGKWGVEENRKVVELIFPGGVKIPLPDGFTGGG